MDRIINAKELRASLPDIVRRVRQGQRYTVIYRSRPAFRLVPVEQTEGAELPPLHEDPLYRSPPSGRSTDGLSSRDHDALLYGKGVKP
jgi:prevent-host-death family protein